jgi:hypothetical protein
MKRNSLLLFLAMFACGGLCAAQAPAVSGAAATYHPGDTVWIDVHFSQPANIGQGDLFFDLVGQPPQDQQGLGFRFGGKSGNVQKVSSTDYRIGEKVPHGIASGEYRLARVQIMVGNMFRGYEFGSSFHNQVVIRVVNQRVTAPPSIQSLKLIPPQQK